MGSSHWTPCLWPGRKPICSLLPQTENYLRDWLGLIDGEPLKPKWETSPFIYAEDGDEREFIGGCVQSTAAYRLFEIILKCLPGGDYVRHLELLGRALLW
eukprot:EG_transcript_70455